MENTKKMLSFIQSSPTSYQAVDTIKGELDKLGFIELKEGETFKLEKGKSYYVTRNYSSIIAFKVGTRLDRMSYHIVASHSDAPSFKLKPKNKKNNSGYEVINTEVYGGPIYNTWMDRLLSIAGRVIVKENDQVVIKPVHIKTPMCIIPNLAIHMNRSVNDGVKLNPQIDLLPMVSKNQSFDVMDVVAKEVNVNKENILDTDLFLYPVDQGAVWGDNNEFVSIYHLDDLQCAYTTLQGFIKGSNQDTVSVYCCFDNEEVGSGTKQGADSTFLMDTLQRINSGLGNNAEQLQQALASSMIVSADNAHSIHPNHPEKSDPTNVVSINDGIVLKYNANQHYSTDGLSAALFKEICHDEQIKFQSFTNRSDERGGGTLGAISTSHVSILSVDIGCAQLAMHSAFETAGVQDTDMMILAMEKFFSAHLVSDANHQYRIER
ncbi:M18 family aminopeptidase [Anaerorhabdus furcosa]|uniref:M18 family aminopeptidase n=1 Tax=Anaerorhabdus furcosa TaxID=118967 RepID=A0A1T4JXK5_9FIRM|nr:M18 family aminopeptidase [Anaerorhabdus furcosa]SJZ34858.1 aspartyl aminopeptidase [Anaerorhabdus furcosa]